MAAAVRSELVSQGRRVSNTPRLLAAHVPDSQQAPLGDSEPQLCRALASLSHCSRAFPAWYYQNYPRNFLMCQIISHEQAPLSLHLYRASRPSLALCYSSASSASSQYSACWVNGKDHQAWRGEDFSLIPNSSYLFLGWYGCQAEELSCGTQGAQG